jgi:hypothetical protein
MKGMFSIGLTALAALVILGCGWGAHGGGNGSVIIGSDEKGLDAGTMRQGAAGRITSLEGNPIEGAFVQARSLGTSGPPIPDIGIFSNNQGQYMWPLLPGTYVLSVTAEGYRPASGRVTVKAGQVATLDFALERAP